MKHFLMMLLGCGLPLLAIFLLPAMGVSNLGTMLIFIVLMFVCHLFHLGMRDHSNEGSIHEHRR